MLAVSFASSAARVFAFDPLSSYRSCEIEGFKVLIHPQVFEHPDEVSRGLELIQNGLRGVKAAVGEQPLVRLQDVVIVLEWEQRIGGGAACYHKSRDWLRENGYDPAKQGCVEISNLRSFIAAAATDQPMVILHELAHAYHNQVLGLDYAAVNDAYRSALGAGIYDEVLRVGGWRGKAYAMNNAEEYFAELTEAYFGRNDFFPFTAGQLQKHDPVGYAAVSQAWTIAVLPQTNRILRDDESDD